MPETKWRPGLVMCDGCGLYVEFTSGGLGGSLCAPCATEFTDRNFPRAGRPDVDVNVAKEWGADFEERPAEGPAKTIPADWVRVKTDGWPWPARKPRGG